jgi:hypothetical protein
MREQLHPRSALRLIAMLMLAIVVQGCGFLFPSAKAPDHPIEVVGVVASEKTGGQGSVTEVSVTFDDGRTFTYNTHYRILAGGRPHVGDLLLAGSKPTPWTIGASPEIPSSALPVGCYLLNENGTEHETTVELDIGLTVPKAPNFETQPVPGVGEHWRGALCLDREGRALEIFVLAD